ncbi:MAG: hypothetical protein KatS3mg064_0019 [Tepidiforma sp.]|nr:MAG: hypothetical protein KatS3mg064_0019 [Tepidiforma sp.]
MLAFGIGLVLALGYGRTMWNSARMLAWRGRAPAPREGDTRVNIFFDVDQTLVHIDQHTNALRPGAREAMQRLKAAGHRVYVWSAAGLAHVERVVHLHGLSEWVDGMFDKDPPGRAAAGFHHRRRLVPRGEVRGPLRARSTGRWTRRTGRLEAALQRLAELGHL